MKGGFVLAAGRVRSKKRNEKGVQLSQSVKTMNVASLSRPCLNTSRKVNKARWPRTCSRPCAFEEKKRKRKTKKERPTQNTPRNPQQPGDRELEAARDEARPTR